MHKCPHCQQKVITTTQKLLSVNFGPAVCRNCQGLSHVHIINGLIALTLWIVLTWVFIGLTWMSRSSFFLLGTIPALILSVNKYLIEAPLLAVRKH
ncbi:MAG: hypothetical protein WD601_08925 [Pseudohongiellaceae bacterium]